MFFSEHNTIVYASSPISAHVAQLSGCFVSMKDFDHITMIFGVGTLDSACSAIVECDADGSGAGTAMAFNYATLASGASALSLLGTPTSAASTGYDFTATGDNTAIVVEIDGSELAEGYPYVRGLLKADDDALGTIFYILSRPRYTDGKTL